jgi:DNA segregation ATPase FtsK/SpoIIIE, S-DNA-T family
MSRTNTLEQAFKDFGFNVEVISVKSGPLVSTYEIQLERGVRANKIVALTNDVARCIGVQGIRIITTPGRNSLSVEVPNEQRQSIPYEDLLASPEFMRSSAALPIILGRAITGEAIVSDLATMPHLLVAGTTGSGKSVGVNSMILSLLYRFSAEQCRFLFIDPKMLELSVYDGIPHLLRPTITDPKVAIEALGEIVQEMEDRYRLLASAKVRNIANYNENHTDKLPYIVVVIDEFADLIQMAGKALEGLVQRIAQKARAAGIHLIMATQRPSVDVVTGVLKANLPTRISFKVASGFDSRTILGEEGAENLLGKGDMLLMEGNSLKRVHGAFVSDELVQGIVEARKGRTPIAPPKPIEKPSKLDEVKLRLRQTHQEPSLFFLIDEFDMDFDEAEEILEQLGCAFSF